MNRLLRAAGFSWRGLCAAWRDESAFRLEAVATPPLLILACIVDVGGGERAILVLSVVLVLVVELLNTAAEANADLAGTAHNPLAAKAKDCGSAAVLLTIFAAVAAWGLILWS